MTLKEFLQRYQYDPLEDELGRGGFGAVYRARDTSKKNRYVAIKVSEVSKKLGKFTLQREAELTRDIDPHNNIATYTNNYRFTSDTRQVFDYAISKYYEHGNLSTVLKKHQLDQTAKIQIAAGLLDGLAHLHKEQIIHRDFKSPNILMDRKEGNWVPKIADFGLGKLVDSDGSVSNSAIGLSYAYAAPEQVNPSRFLGATEKIRKNVDIWALGVILYEIFVGYRPFRASGLHHSDQGSINAELMRQIQNLDYNKTALDEVLQPYRAMIEHCLVLDKAARAQDVAALLTLQETFEEQPPGTIDEPQPPNEPPQEPQPPGTIDEPQSPNKPPQEPQSPDTGDQTQAPEEPQPPGTIDEPQTPEEPQLADTGDQTQAPSEPPQEPQLPGTIDDPQPLSEPPQEPKILTKKKAPLPWLIAAIVLLIGGLWSYTAYQDYRAEQKRQADQAAYNRALTQNDSSAYATYLENHPTGLHIVEAKTKLDSITSHLAQHRRLAAQKAEAKRKRTDIKKKSGTTIQGQTYKTIKIGNQVWMAENLNIEIDGSSCYDDDPANCEKYGRLYTWEAAKRIADQTPGWHLPTDEEWKTLEMALGMSRSEADDIYDRGSPVGAKLKQGGSSGFEALLAGRRDSGGLFDYLGVYGSFWSASPYGSSTAWGRFVYASHSYVRRYNSNRASRFSVRLVKD